MGIFGLFSKKTKGLIRYHELADWWDNELSDTERRTIQEKYRPMGTQENVLTEGEVSSSAHTTIAFLTFLAGWLKSKEDRSIARKILKKAEEYLDDKTDILDQHFYYLAEIQLYYKDREKPKFLQKVVDACKKQVKISKKAVEVFKKEYPKNPLPGHTGYEQLSIIYDKQGKHKEAIKLSKEALGEGWMGDWEKRIGRYHKKLNYAKNNQKD